MRISSGAPILSRVILPHRHSDSGARAPLAAPSMLLNHAISCRATPAEDGTALIFRGFWIKLAGRKILKPQSGSPYAPAGDVSAGQHGFGLIELLPRADHIDLPKREFKLRSDARATDRCRRVPRRRPSATIAAACS
jgi:hypothetical protein